MPEAYWEDEKRGLTIYHGDCRAILPTFADGEFGSVVTDPPYGIGFADWDIPPDSAILQECLRVAEGSVVMFGGAKPESLAVFLGLSPRPDRMMVWNCSNSASGWPGIVYALHPLWVWRVPRPVPWGIMHDVITESVTPGELAAHKAVGHPTWKPVRLMEPLVRVFGGRSTLDPYMGSGTTLVAAAKLGIPACGVEREEKYCRMAVCRLEGGFMADEPAHLFNQPDSAAG